MIQRFGSLVKVRLGLDEDVRHRSVQMLNRLLAHTTAIRDLYKKYHWQTSGANFFDLHLLFDKHSNEQAETMDLLAERVQALGGVALSMAPHVGAETRLARAPLGVESPSHQLQRLVDAHEFLLVEARPLAREAAFHWHDDPRCAIAHAGLHHSPSLTPNLQHFGKQGRQFQALRTIESRIHALR